jgi:hypothetical protein
MRTDACLAAGLVGGSDCSGGERDNRRFLERLREAIGDCGMRLDQWEKEDRELPRLRHLE